MISYFSKPLACDYLLPWRESFNAGKIGYIAGRADGIVSINSKGARRIIQLLEIDEFKREIKVLAQTRSNETGNYIFHSLDPDKYYFVLARDWQRDFEPVAIDQIKPASDLNYDEIYQLVRTWTMLP